MESLSPECTPLKHRYDSCFNLWFEGYLQPALDASSSSTPSSSSSTLYTTPAPSSQIQSLQVEDKAAPTPVTPQSAKPPIITNWSAAFRRRPRQHLPGQPSPFFWETDETPEFEEHHDASHPPIDTTGKTRAQIKAEEYDRACGKSWREYQGCLKKAIATNHNLSTLLEQAREEHPLKSQDRLGGTPWDPEVKPSTAE